MHAFIYFILFFLMNWNKCLLNGFFMGTCRIIIPETFFLVLNCNYSIWNCLGLLCYVTNITHQKRKSISYLVYQKFEYRYFFCCCCWFHNIPFIYTNILCSVHPVFLYLKQIFANEKWMLLSMRNDDEWLHHVVDV